MSSVFLNLVHHPKTPHMSPRWGLGVGSRRCYTPIAPLGLWRSGEEARPTGIVLKGARFSMSGIALIHRRGEVSSPDGLGDPTPTKGHV